MISYAQNREDVVLARLFDGTTGFYVDLGASDPVVDSVTKHFYDQGWRGLNVEPLPDEIARLRAARPRDVCVQAAVTDRSGTATLHVGPRDSRGRSTIFDNVATQLPAGGAVETVEVPTVRFTDLLADHGVIRIDLLKIDVEGAEAAVINDTDWTAVRPRVIVVEATVPGEATPAHEDWEPALLAAGYTCTLFDGLNRFYALADDHEAIAALSVPANVHDGAEPFLLLQHVRNLEEMIRAEREARATTMARIEAVDRALADLARESRELAEQTGPGAQAPQAGPGVQATQAGPGDHVPTPQA